MFARRAAVSPIECTRRGSREYPVNVRCFHRWSYQAFELTNGLADGHGRRAAVRRTLLEVPDLHATLATGVDMFIHVGNGHGADDVAVNEMTEDLRATWTLDGIERIGRKRERL